MLRIASVGTVLLSLSETTVHTKYDLSHYRNNGNATMVRGDIENFIMAGLRFNIGV